MAAAATTALTTDLVVPTHAATSGPKNIIYMIGDGMSYGHIASNSLYETGQSKYLGRVSYMRNQTRIAASTTPARYVTASLS
ncbi:hypothetical protein CKF55_01070 [Corynebacterium striatum]|nr:hypothetical protein CKF55_01070 [Corynebacterium striatum]